MQTKLVLKQRTALKLRFQPGATGPAGQIVSVDATTLAAGSPATVVNNGTPEAAELVFGIPEGDQGIQGETGDNGWTPELAVVTDGTRRVQQVVDWFGGEGTKPATGDYVGATGLTPTIGDAVDIRGPAGTATIPDGDKGDITTSDDGDTWTINADAVGENELADDAVDNAKLANMATARFKGRATAGTGDPEDLTGTQATELLDAFTGDSGSGGAKGLVPAPGAGDAAKVLTGNGSWTALTGYKLRQTTIFTSSGTWTKQSWCKAVRVTVVGGGGGGGGGATTTGASGGGGGGGGTSIKTILAASLGTTESVAVGAAASGGGSGGAGSTGTTASFGSHCSATGGGFGQGSTDTTSIAIGGAGGTGSGGDINIGGSGGQPSAGTGNTGRVPGCGGPSTHGGGGVATTNAGGNGRAYGGGGAGGRRDASSNGDGGTGAAGIVIVEEFE